MRTRTLHGVAAAALLTPLLVGCLPDDNIDLSVPAGAALTTEHGAPGQTTSETITPEQTTPMSVPLGTTTRPTTTPEPTTTTTTVPPVVSPNCGGSLNRNGTVTSFDNGGEVVTNDVGAYFACNGGPLIQVQIYPGVALVLRHKGARVDIAAGRTKRVGPYRIHTFSVTSNLVKFRFTTSG